MPKKISRHRAAPSVFGVAIALTLTGIVGLQIIGYSHARLIFLALLYVCVLPALVWYWHESRSDTRNAFTIPDGRILLILVFAAVTISMSYSFYLYDRAYSLADESSYLFQARVFAAGQMKADPMPGSPDTPEVKPVELYFENQVHTIHGWFSKYPPGWPLVLAAGYLAKCPWLVNPILGILVLLLVDRIAALWGRTTRIVAVGVASCSAYAMLYSTGFLSHSCAALAGTAGVGAAFKGARDGRLRWVLLCFGLLILDTEIRPYTALVFFIVCAGYTLSAFRANPTMFARCTITIGAATAAAVALLLFVNHAYTGNFMISPYAYARGSTTVAELTLDPSRIAHTIESFWRVAATDTLCFTFPFLFVAAIYACINERSYRRELIALAVLFPILIFAYTFQSEASGSFDGERYYYEGYPAICVVAARGLALLVDRWNLRPAAVRHGLLALLAVHAIFIAIMIHDVKARLNPWRTAYESSVRAPSSDVVFLNFVHTPSFASRHANWNEARWKKARTVFLNDPGVERRGEVTCRFHRHSYRVVVYDGQNRSATAKDFLVACRP